MGKSGKVRDVEILPAILVKTREDFLESVEKVAPFAKQVHVDMMDDVFVPNKTIGPEELNPLPTGIAYSFHWMVESPQEAIAQIRGPHTHVVHVETLESGNRFEELRKEVEAQGGKMGISLSPDTPLNDILPYADSVSRFLIMSVVPGFYGQTYMPEVEPKISRLREECPSHDIEVDGGINFETAKRAAAAGANMLASASTLFNAPDMGEAIAKMKKAAEEA
jgi:ribulose-phosphate 3-epimerase